MEALAEFRDWNARVIFLKMMPGRLGIWCICLFSKQQGYFRICGLISNPKKKIVILFSYHLLCRDLVTNARIIGDVVGIMYIFPSSLQTKEIALSLNLNESRWIQTRCFLFLFPLTNHSSTCFIECPKCNDQLVPSLLGLNVHGSGSKLNVYFSNCFIGEFC